MHSHTLEKISLVLIRDAIAVLHILYERNLEYINKVYVCYADFKQETQLSLKNCVRRLGVSQGHQTIPYVRYGFLLVCYSNIVPKTRSFSGIQKMSWPWNLGQRSLKVPFDRLYMVSYYYPIVTLSMRRTVFEIFDFKNAVTLKTGLRIREGHWKCHHSI